ncbi:MAG TPA: polysaccharide deacetylase family protein [Cryomorphaceae bacterium]|nr:polysaccharide deacetylase family protein [Cryomorphaceae bacterium]
MYLVKTPEVLKPFAGDLLWNESRDERVVYLTFDDGPTESYTLEIIDILKEFDALATFFCIGGNVVRFPKAYQALLDAGHKTANHTWNHMNGWEFSDFSYFKNVLECESVVDSNLFRPPYGRITRSQVQTLKKRYKIVMWDVLAADWRSDVSPEKCLSNVVDNSTSGSIVVFHDSEKAYKNMIYALPRSLKRLQEQGYTFSVLG